MVQHVVQQKIVKNSQVPIPTILTAIHGQEPSEHKWTPFPSWMDDVTLFFTLSESEVSARSRMRKRADSAFL